MKNTKLLLTLLLVGAMSLAMYSGVYAEEEGQSTIPPSTTEQSTETTFKSVLDAKWANPSADNYVKELELSITSGLTKISVVYPTSAKAPSVTFTSLATKKVLSEDTDKEIYSTMSGEPFKYNGVEYTYKNFFFTGKESATYLMSVSLNSPNADLIITNNKEAQINNSLTPSADALLYYFTSKSTLFADDIPEVLKAGNKTFEQVEVESNPYIKWIILGVIGVFVLSVVITLLVLRSKKKRKIAAEEESRRYVRAMNKKFRKTKEQERAHLEKILASYDDDYVDEVKAHEVEPRIVEYPSREEVLSKREEEREDIELSGGMSQRRTDNPIPPKPVVPEKPILPNTPPRPNIKRQNADRIFG